MSVPSLVVHEGESYPDTIVVQDDDARDRNDRDDEIDDAGRPPLVPRPAPPPTADLEASVTVSPNPTLAGLPAKWTLTVRNAADAYVANIGLGARFSGISAPELELVSSPTCSLQSLDDFAALDCHLGPLAGGQSHSIEILGGGSEAGELLGVTTVSITDSVPLDDALGNNEARATLTVAMRLSSGPAQQIAAPGGLALAAGDFDGDGLEDIAVATRFGETTLIFLNGRNPVDEHKRRFAPTPRHVGTSAAGNDIAAADLDGDGHVDLVVANADGDDQILFNDGSGRFAVIALSGSAAPSNAVALGDVDGDGLVDLVFANAGGGTIYLNHGGRSFVPGPSLEPAHADSADVVIVDLLGDLRPELVFATRAGDAAVYQSSGGVVLAATLPTGPTTSVSAADFDGDGRLDLAFTRSADAARPARVLAYFNRSMVAPLFLLADEFGGSSTVDIIADDVDLDGLDDVIAINAVGSHQLYTSSLLAGSLAFVLNPEQFEAGGAVASVAGKFSPDDRVDLAIIGADRLSIFFNDGHGNLGAGDVDAPALTLVGPPVVAFPVGEPYADEGATAMDAIDGDVTPAVEVDNPVDSKLVATYTVSYSVVDSSGNSAATVQRIVQVKTSGGSGGGGGGAASIAMLLLLAMVSLLRVPKTPSAEGRHPAAIRRLAAPPASLDRSLCPYRARSKSPVVEIA